jgi:hypothetical protein
VRPPPFEAALIRPVAPPPTPCGCCRLATGTPSRSSSCMRLSPRQCATQAAATTTTSRISSSTAASASASPCVRDTGCAQPFHRRRPRSARTRKCPHAMRRCVHPADNEGLSGAPPTFFKLATAAMLGYNGLFFARACIGVPRVRGLFSCYLGEDALMALLALASCLTNDVVCHTPPHLRTDASAHAPTRLCDCALVPRYWAATYFGCWSPSPSFQTPCTCARCASCVATLSAAPSMCR